MQRRKNRAQSFVEYAVLIALAVAVLIGMRIYMVRGVQERYRQAGDVFGQGEQYAKGATQVTESSSSTIPTVSITSSTDPCLQVVARVRALETDIENLNSRAGPLEQAAADLAALIPDLAALIPLLIAQPGQLRSFATQRRNEANDKQAEAQIRRRDAANLQLEVDPTESRIGQYKTDYPWCFGGEEREDCSHIVSTVARWERDVAPLRREINDLREWAIKLEAEAADLNRQAGSLEESAVNVEKAAADLEADTIPQLETQAQEQSAPAASLRREAGDKQAEVDQLRSDNPSCF